MKRILTYNVNGIRAALKKGLMEWLKLVNPDIICIQEVKADYTQIPVFDFEEAGYHHYWYPAKKKGYSGVGLLSKIAPDKVVKGMGIDKYDNEGRLLRADYGDISVISVYHPSGSSGEERQDFKMIWLNDFLNFIKQLRKERQKLIICGDFNICHKAIDIHDPIRNATNSGFLPEERQWMSEFLDSGFVDCFRFSNNEPHQYTWWSYRTNARQRNLGWRIDYNMVSENLKSCIVSTQILPEAMHSDHCPVLTEIKF